MVGRYLEQHGYRLDVFVVCDNIDVPVSHRPFPSLDGVDVLVAMGAPWSVYDTDRIGTWVGSEIELVRAAHQRGIPYLGICFGGQVLAAALGGAVEPAPRPELGWGVVHSVEPDFVATGPWFQWHSDRFVPPEGSQLLAHNDVGAQAFRVGTSVGVQFHPEVDLELLESWLEEQLAGAPPTDPIFAQVGTDAKTLIARCEEHASEAAANTRALVDAFLRLR